ncbi:sugar phosphate isomerase/epimerase [Lewinella sp. W8]|uniref:sugar phosphate isomerase/epimerase family protein n=1 Tax=Lewinella sp. W8 TaxID=2528208 RepID=UPI001566DB1E|nr:sugar phosphate isomerase/epimerase [Lewinella sp. W8]
MQRRTVLEHLLLGAGGLMLLPGCTASKEVAAARERAIGVQLFTIPGLVDQDFSGTLKLLGDIGYREVETFGPYPFSAEVAKEQWAGMKPMLGLKNDAFYGYSSAETARMMKDNGLSVPSAHTDLITLRTGMTKLLDGLAPLEPQYVVLPALSDVKDRANLDAYRRLAEEFNGFGEQMASYGMQFVYHNHGYEHIVMDGQQPLDFLLDNTEEDKVAFELDMFWMKAAGAEPISYLKKYPGRFKMLHIKDASEPFRFAGDGSTPDQWMAGFAKMADPGTGVLDVAEIVATAAVNGTEHFFLERDLAPEPTETLRNSFTQLKGM